MNAKKRAALETRYLKAKEAYDRCCSEIQHRQARSRRFQLFIKEIGQMDGLMEEFDPRTFGIFVDHMTVHKDKTITICRIWIRFVEHSPFGLWLHIFFLPGGACYGII